MGNDLAMCWRLAGRTFAPYMASLPGGTGSVDTEGWMAPTGEPIGSLNMAFAEDGPAAERYLAGIADGSALRRLPVVVVMAPAFSARIAPVAASLGFRASAGLPVMATHRAAGGDAQPVQGNYRVSRVERDDERLSALRLQAGAFGMPFASLERIFPAAFVDAPWFDLFLATRDGEPFSTVTTATGDGVTGLWSMATPPAWKRQGAARAVVEAAIAHHRALGVECFYLGASPAGRPLYTESGFRTVADTAVWEAGPA